MRPTLRLFQRQPLIRFLGKRSTPTQVDHTPHVHPAAPTNQLPQSFAAYRQKAQQHGPLSSQRPGVGAIGGQSGSSLGPIEPGSGMAFDRNELPQRFRRLSWSAMEIEAIETGGASMVA